MNRLVESHYSDKMNPYRRSYDAAGNVRFDQSTEYPQIDFTYDTNNRLISTSGSSIRSFEYDGLGNVVGDGVRTFGYALDGNLLLGGLANQEKMFLYDGNDKMTVEERAGETIYHVYLGNLLLMEYNLSKQSYIEYVYLGGMLVGSRTVNNADITDADGDGVPDASEFKGLGRSGKEI